LAGKEPEFMDQRRIRRRWLLGALLFAATGWAQPAVTSPAAKSPESVVTVDVVDGTGKKVGNVRVLQTPHGLLLRGALTGIPPGEHAIHVHETGKCEGPSFKTAGAHFNPTKREHGALLPDGPHAGDLPNIFAAADGSLKFEILAPDLTLAPGPSSVFDADGSAIVLHAKADDYRTQPTGDSGDRVACGVLKG